MDHGIFMYSRRHCLPKYSNFFHPFLLPGGSIDASQFKAELTKCVRNEKVVAILPFRNSNLR